MPNNQEWITEITVHPQQRINTMKLSESVLQKKAFYEETYTVQSCKGQIVPMSEQVVHQLLLHMVNTKQLKAKHGINSGRLWLEVRVLSLSYSPCFLEFYGKDILLTLG